MPLIDEIFNKDETHQICSIPISEMGYEDNQIWNFTKDGKFSVRSAYYLSKTRKKRGKGETSRGEQKDGFWKSLWEICVPPAVKTFLWEAGNDILPTKFNLFCRNIIESPLCPICQREDETVMHAIWSPKELKL